MQFSELCSLSSQVQWKRKYEARNYRAYQTTTWGMRASAADLCCISVSVSERTWNGSECSVRGDVRGSENLPICDSHTQKAKRRCISANPFGFAYQMRLFRDTFPIPDPVHLLAPPQFLSSSITKEWTWCCVTWLRYNLSPCPETLQMQMQRCFAATTSNHDE